MKKQELLIIYLWLNYSHMGDFISRKTCKISKNIVKSLKSIPSFTYSKTTIKWPRLESLQEQIWPPGLMFDTSTLWCQSKI